MATNPVPKSASITRHEQDFARRLDCVMAAVDLYHTPLLNYLRTLTTHHNAEDILQELWKFVVVHFSEDKIDCFPLLRRKAYQLFVDDYRRNVARSNVMETAKHEIAPDEARHVYDESDEGRLQTKFWQEFPVELT